MDLLLRIHGLAGGDGYHLVDVIDGAAATEVIDGTGDTLEDGTDGIGVAEALYEFGADVADFEVGEYEHIGLSCPVFLEILTSHAWAPNV